MPPPSAPGDVRLLPSGDQCLIVQFGEGVDIDVNRRACAFARLIEAAGWPFTADVVPSFTGIGLHYRAELVPLHAGESPLAAVGRLIGDLARRAGGIQAAFVRALRQAAILPSAFAGRYDPQCEGNPWEKLAADV
ncbi:MAG TPA: carboxyltransferase domain-containing protein, partial [Burkholderiaceae bacterium]|nr:carboxyltransferase domain-containing protein [Burkholderiaceae bacterium]